MSVCVSLSAVSVPSSPKSGPSSCLAVRYEDEAKRGARTLQSSGRALTFLREVGQGRLSLLNQRGRLLLIFLELLEGHLLLFEADKLELAGIGRRRGACMRTFSSASP